MASPTPTSQDNRNLLIAVLICTLVFIGFDYFRLKNAPQIQHDATTEQVVDNGEIVSPGAPTLAMHDASAALQNLHTDERGLVELNTANFDGRVALKGGRIDMLRLLQYTEDLEHNKPIDLFTPSGKRVFFFEAGWLAENLATPDGNTVWKAETEFLTMDNPLTITWDNGEGLEFQRTYILNPDDYTITVTDGISNTSGKDVTLVHYAQLHKGSSPEETKKMIADSTFTRFVGPEGVIAGKHTSVDYEDLMALGFQEFTTRQGWVGISEPYFIGAIIPEQQEMNKKTTFRYNGVRGKNFFSVDVQGEPVVVPAGGYRENTYDIFAGPKKIALLEKPEAQLELAVDFGWYHVIAKFFFDGVMWLYGLVGNLGVAVMLMTLLIKIALWPLAGKSYVAMAQMKKLQPKMEQLKEKHGDDRQAMTMEMMALYRQHKVNPMSGCWPMLIQIPIFFAFYKMILISFEFRHEPFFGWIVDLSARDPYFVLPIIMGVTMYVQQKLNPPPADPVQAKVMGMLPWIFTVMFAIFPAGLVLYWTTNSIISVAQQYVVMRRLGVNT